MNQICQDLERFARWVSNKCLSKHLYPPLWRVECYPPGMNADLSVLSFIPLLRDKRKDPNSMNFIPTDDCHLYPLPWFLVPSPPWMLMEPFLEHTRALWTFQEHDQGTVELWNPSGPSHTSNMCTLIWAGTVAATHLQGRFLKQCSEDQDHTFSSTCWWVNCSQIWRALHTIQCFSWTSWNLSTMWKCCKCFYTIFWMLSSSNFGGMILELRGKND